MPLARGELRPAMPLDQLREDVAPVPDAILTDMVDALHTLRATRMNGRVRWISW